MILQDLSIGKIVKAVVKSGSFFHCVQFEDLVLGGAD